MLTKLPRWATGGLADVTEPSSGRKDLGWEVDQIPPAGYENWLDLQGYAAHVHALLELPAVKAIANPLLALVAGSSYSTASGRVHAFKYSSALDLWIFIGADGEIQSSPNGITWTRRIGGTHTDDLFAAVLRTSSTLFVVAGENGRVYTSPDGTTWTARTPVGTPTFYGAAYTTVFTRFCLVGTSGTIQTSSDGITWTARTPAASFAGTFYDVAWSPTVGLFCAVGAGGVIQTSSDGITWFSRTSGTADDLFGVVWGNDRFRTNKGWSLDGITWVVDDAGAGSQRAFYSRGVFILSDTAATFTVDYSGAHMGTGHSPLVTKMFENLVAVAYGDDTKQPYFLMAYSSGFYKGEYLPPPPTA